MNFDIIGTIGGIISQVLPDTKAKDKALAELDLRRLEIEAKLQDAITQENLGQIEINKIEAGHSNIFVSGWRPFIGWACGIAIVWAFLLQPFFTWFAMMIGHDITVDSSNTDQLFQLVLAMLGMGGLRTFEKIKGVAK
jgi:hypothetical protein